jgi:hypothetical protein
MFYRYRFESEFYASLSRIPMHVRMKLDLTGSKISLTTWLAFSMEEREVLCHLPIETEEEKKVFSAFLDSLTRRYIGAPLALLPVLKNPPWEDSNQVPEPVRTKAQEKGLEVARSEWSRWNPYQRYALFKLAISKNDREQFHAALEEFRSSPAERSNDQTEIER